MKLCALLPAVLWVTTSSAQIFTVLHSFSGPDGQRAESRLALEGNTLYGTTSGGFSDNGTLFKVNTDGTGFAIVHSWGDPDWFYPRAVILSGSTLYGATDGGANGTVFKVNTDGSGYAVLKAFATNESGLPRDGLVLGGDTLYGSTGGTVFKIN